jgi:hypothetical protein
MSIASHNGGVERTGQLVQEPVRGRAEALLVLDGSTGHNDCCARLVVRLSEVLEGKSSQDFDRFSTVWLGEN